MPVMFDSLYKTIILHIGHTNSSAFAMEVSTVKWFDARKGYGFIADPTSGTDIFVHYSSILTNDSFKALKPGEKVTFEIQDGPRGKHALEVRRLDDEANLPFDAQPA